MLMYAVKPQPTNEPKIEHMTESRNPRLKTRGPRKPTVRLLAEMLALNQRKVIWA